MADFLFLFLGLGIGSGATYLWWQQQLISLVPKENVNGFTSLGQVRRLLDRQNEDVVALQADITEAASILAAVPLGYLAVNDANCICYANIRAGELLHQPALPTQTRPLIEVVRSWELDALVAQTRATGLQQVQDWRFTFAVNQGAPLRATTIPLQDGGVGIFLEDRHEQANLILRRDQWTADVAHELKTPLTSMRLVIETLKNRVEPVHARWLERLLKEVMRLTQLVEDLLCLNQFTSDRTLALQTKSRDLVQILRECWQMTQPLAEAQQITLVYEGPDQLPAEVDEALLYRAFLNLFDNALKFSPEGSTLTLRVGDLPNGVAIEFLDQGPGFPPQDLERVFERFYRADPARSRQTGGSGLGLAIVREIIYAHGGDIRAANHGSGGAWLTIQLPATLLIAPAHSPQGL